MGRWSEPAWRSSFQQKYLSRLIIELQRRRFEQGSSSVWAVKLAADVSLAMVVRGRTAWSRAIIFARAEMAMAAPLDRVWEIGSDFCGMKKWYPALLLCERVEGTPEQGSGCVRDICRACSSPSGEEILRAKEKLISMDSINYSYTYAVIDINIEGFKGYQATFQVTESKEGSCAVKWNFEIEPVPGRSEAEFVSKWSSALASILTTLEQFASSL